MLKKNRLRIEDLTVSRGCLTLLEGISCALNAGEGLHILGPNGSGKTSLLMTIAGLLTPTKGRILFNERPVHAADIHWFGDGLGMKPDLTLDENLSLWAWVDQAPRTKIYETLRSLDMHNHLHTPYKNLSQGQQKRAALSRLLLKRRPIWLLDEPYTHLDEQGIILLDHQIRYHFSHGGIVILTSHKSIELQGFLTLSTEADPELDLRSKEGKCLAS